ncbi:MAG TPA: four helix bundle protein [Patescibacteria group bacterium]|nr:four helix bundle protein [Patescibacteria group bacterium]
MKNAEKITDIHERIYQFVVRIVTLTKSLQKTPENLILINQITRSATSMGQMIKKQMALIAKKILSLNMLL